MVIISHVFSNLHRPLVRYRLYFYCVYVIMYKMKLCETSSPTIDVRANWLHVNSHTLRADILPSNKALGLEVDPEELRAIIDLGRYAILDGIEAFYKRTKQANPGSTVVHPSIWTAQLGTSEQTDGVKTRVFTPKGYENGGVIEARDELQEPFRAFWDAVLAEGFLPEVRRTSGALLGGAWLALRRPTLAQVSEYWLDDPNVMPLLDPDNLKPTAEGLREFQEYSELLIDMRDGTLQSVNASAQERASTRSRLQISALLASAAYKHTTLLGEYGEDMEDAVTYATYTDNLAPGTVLAIEQAVFE